jgi:hypothetical protein
MTKNLVYSALVALAVSFVFGLVIKSNQSNIVGGLSERDVQAVSMKIGAKGTKLTLVGSGTCSLVSNSSIAATSTGTGTCVTTGSIAGDQVVISLATTTTKIAAQWALVGTVATTDSTTVRLLNLTGTAAVPSATNGLGSSTQYAIYRD